MLTARSDNQVGVGHIGGVEIAGYYLLGKGKLPSSDGGIRCVNDICSAAVIERDADYALSVARELLRIEAKLPKTWRKWGLVAREHYTKLGVFFYHWEGFGFKISVNKLHNSINLLSRSFPIFRRKGEKGEITDSLVLCSANNRLHGFGTCEVPLCTGQAATGSPPSVAVHNYCNGQG